MKNKYKEGEEVYAQVNPSLELIIRRFVDRTIPGFSNHSKTANTSGLLVTKEWKVFENPQHKKMDE